MRCGVLSFTISVSSAAHITEAKGTILSVKRVKPVNGKNYFHTSSSHLLPVDTTSFDKEFKEFKEIDASVDDTPDATGRGGHQV